MLFRLSIFFILSITAINITAQNKTLLNNIGNQLDSLNIYIQNTEAEKQQLYNELIKDSRLITIQENKIDSLNFVLTEKTAFMDSQETFLGVFMAIAAIALFAVISLIVTIFEKKKVNKDLESKNTLIKTQVEQLKQKNKEITDSINYAKKIQNAILPSKNDIKSKLPESFIYYRPKDIISGDFYWLTEKDEKIYFVTADCTGHGVPGALMSMLGITYLNQIINEKRILQPSIILDELKNSIINSLTSSEDGESLKDGMDMTLYSLDKKNMKLNYSAANNGLYIIREREIIKLEADKQPVGANPKEHHSFTNYSFDLKPNDLIISYSDGFPDQFGGPKGKKYKYKQLQDLLIELNNKPIDTVPVLLNSIFEKWKGSLEQVDDVLIVGVRV